MIESFSIVVFVSDSCRSRSPLSMDQLSFVENLARNTRQKETTPVVGQTISRYRKLCSSSFCQHLSQPLQSDKRAGFTFIVGTRAS